MWSSPYQNLLVSVTVCLFVLVYMYIIHFNCCSCLVKLISQLTWGSHLTLKISQIRMEHMKGSNRTGDAQQDGGCIIAREVLCTEETSSLLLLGTECTSPLCLPVQGASLSQVFDGEHTAKVCCSAQVLTSHGCRSRHTNWVDTDYRRGWGGIHASTVNSSLPTFSRDQR